MDTYFASPERVSDDELAIEIDIVSKNPVMSSLLNSISGLLAIMDEHRQIVSLNDSFLQMLDIGDPKKILGLRQGEVLQCIHANEAPGTRLRVRKPSNFKKITRRSRSTQIALCYHVCYAI